MKEGPDSSSSSFSMFYFVTFAGVYVFFLYLCSIVSILSRNWKVNEMGQIRIFQFSNLIWKMDGRLILFALSFLYLFSFDVLLVYFIFCFLFLFFLLLFPSGFLHLSTFVWNRSMASNLSSNETLGREIYFDVAALLFHKISNKLKVRLVIGSEINPTRTASFYDVKEKKMKIRESFAQNLFRTEEFREPSFKFLLVLHLLLELRKWNFLLKALWDWWINFCRFGH